MQATVPVVLVHGDERERGQLRAALEALAGVQIAGERAELRAGMALARQVRPAILVLELRGSGEEALAAAEHYRLEHPEVALFLATEALHPETLVRAMRAGAQEVLRRPLDRGALAAAVERVQALAARRQGGGSPRSVVTVYSSKGGVGVSTVATNLALSLRRQTGQAVALADLDYQSGDVATMLGLVPVRTVAEALGAERLESAGVQDAMTRHGSGLWVLAQPEQIDRLDPEALQRVGAMLEVVAATYELVVVDAPHLINEVALEIFDRSSTILLVVEPSLPSVRAARRTLDIFQRLNYLAVPERVRVVLNRASERGAITAAQVEETLELPVCFAVANDYAAVSEAINLGRPLCAEAPASRAGRDIDRIARDLVSPGEEPVGAGSTRRRRLGFLGRGHAT